MENIKELLKTRKLNKLPYWKEVAIRIVNEFETESKDKSSVFGKCKANVQRADQAYKECIELKKPYVKYWFKLMSL